MLPIQLGQSDFTQLRQRGGLYIDKSGFVSTVITDPALVQLYPRPRRFGKTLNLTTVQAFLEAGPDKTALFEDLSVWGDRVARSHFQKHPVIFLSFKDVKARNWPEAQQQIQSLLALEIRRLLPWLPSESLESWEAMARQQQPIRQDVLLRLSRELSQNAGQLVVLLVDEYDSPLLTAWEHGYFDDAVSWFRSFLSAGLKDNPNLFRGVLTGILRVARESLFSGLNNISIFSLLQEEIPESFGFTEAEVADLLERVGRSPELPEFQRWYNGYRFGDTTVFNPWSILNALARPRTPFQPWWVNTSENTLLRRLLLGNAQFQQEFARLLLGECIESRIEEDMILHEVSSDKLLSFLLFSGYLKLTSRRDERGRIFAGLAIPNLEVRTVWEDSFQAWMIDGLGTLDPLLRAFLTGDALAVEELLGKLLLRHVSTWDLKDTQDEVFYHAFVLGLLVSLEKTHRVQSNREVGRGRADVQIAPKEAGKPGVILEFKKQIKGRTLGGMAEEALKQTATLDYTTELETLGAAPIHRFGIAFAGKKVAVRAA